MMKNAIIFGCGKIGTATYKKLKNQYCILAWSDNNGALWESKKEGIPIVQPIEIPELLKKENADVFVAVENGQEIVEQLRSLQVKNIYIWKKTFFYSADGLFPYKENTGMYYKKNKKEETHILFVSATAGIRDHKTAKAVKKTGKKVHLAYLKFSPYDIDSEYANIYEDIYSFMSIQALQDFIDNSDFDLVHSSSEPDYITALLARSNKPIIHDCHDLSSSNRTMFPEELTLEYIAHKEASGVVYPTEGLRNEAIRRFGLSWDKTYVLENFTSEELIPHKKKEKISRFDGELHCVYEGAILEGDKASKRYFEEIWLKLAKSGIHVHFYTNYDINYCHYLESMNPKIHFEGNLSSKQLSVELSKYDIGLCIYNTNDSNKLYLEHSSPNKLYEYVNAGIPVAVGNVECHRIFAEENGFGRQVNMDRELYSQMRTIAEIKIKERILQEKGFTFESKIQGLLDFYNQAIEQKKQKNP